MHESDVAKKPSAEPKLSGRAIAALILGLLSFGCSCVTGIPAALVGWSALGQIRRGEGEFTGRGMAMLGMLFGLGTTGLTLVAATWVGLEARGLTMSQNHLKNVGVALHNYHDTFWAFPMRGVEFSEQGDAGPQVVEREMLSWRVRILPYLGEEELYRKFDFDETWDSPNNKSLIERMPAIYGTPGRSTPPSKTRIQAVVLPRDPNDLAGLTAQQIRDHGTATVFDFAFPDAAGVVRYVPTAASMKDIRDGTANTIAVVEADEPVIWTKPDDWELHYTEPKRGIGNVRMGGFLILFADGSVRLMPDMIDDETMIRMCIMNDGKDIGLDLRQR